MGLAHGTVGWADVAVPDMAAGEAFYTGLFGWEASPSQDESMPYTMFKKDGKVVAGMGRLSPDQQAAGQPPVWTPYVIVDDIEAAHERAKELGAHILMEPMQIFDAGSMFFAIDPVGAAIGFWQSGEHDGAQVFNEVNTMVWNDLGCRDVAAATEFYTALLGWDAEAMDIGGSSYTMFKVGDRVNGGVSDISQILPDEVPAHWLTWFRVESAAAAAERTTELGGSVMKEPTKTPIGTTAILTDPAGAVFAVIETEQADGQPDR
jgi:predicted enzyme related to lactoylglutathione lyase